MSSANYAVFSYVSDDSRSVNIPIGVALWSPDIEFADFRLLEGDVPIIGLHHSLDNSLVGLARAKISNWLTTRRLPYKDGTTVPWNDEWWRHIKDLLIHRVMISDPHPIDFEDPRDKIDALYEKVCHCTTRSKET